MGDEQFEKYKGVMVFVLLFAGAILIFNQFQLSAISSSLSGLPRASGGIAKAVSFSGGKVDLSGVDVMSISSTAMAVASVFPELNELSTESEIMAFMIPSGMPSYSDALGGVTFDEPIKSMEYLARWYQPLSAEIREKNPEIWKRYIALAAAPRGISCEYCCGIGPQAIDSTGRIMCGCQHVPALQAVTLGLIKYTDYSDAEVLREVMRWKTMFFPQNMVKVALEVAGKDPTSLQSLPGMVGGC